MQLHLKKDPCESETKMVIDSLREQELKEFESFMESPTFYALESVHKSAVVFAVMNDDNIPVALCGIIEEEEENTDLKTGVVWLMSSSEIYKTPVAFYRLIKDLVETYGALYERLYNYVQVEADNHQDFIESLGFGVVDSDLYENKYSGQQYLLFEMLTPRGLGNIYSMSEEAN